MRACLGQSQSVAIASLLGVVLFVASASADTRVETIRDILNDPEDHRVLVVAHRGHHRDAPENSILAIEHAAEAGIHIVEVDVRETADGTLVLMHDSTVDRTTTGDGEINELSDGEVNGLLLKDGLRPTNQRIPTLAQAIEAARSKVILNIDLKDGSVQEVVSLARSMDLADHCLLKAWWHEMSDAEKEWVALQTDILFMPIVRTMDDAVAAMKQVNPGVFEFVRNGSYNELCNVQSITALRAMGNRVWVNSLWEGCIEGKGDYTVPIDGTIFVDMAEAGVGIIQSDLPELAMFSLAEAGLTYPATTAQTPDDPASPIHECSEPNEEVE